MMSNSHSNHSEKFQDDETYLYDKSMLDDLSFEASKIEFKNRSISPQSPGHQLVLRPLCSNDFDKGYLQLLAGLTNVGDVTRQMFLNRFYSMKSCPDTYYVTVLEDTNLGVIVASGTLLVERKFVRECALRGRIEDIVVRDNYQGKELGKIIVETLRLIGRKVKCYKTSLDCTDKMLPFYNKFGFKKDPVSEDSGGGVNNFLVERYDYNNVRTE